MRGLEDPAESRTGYRHARSGLLLIESLKVGETQRLELVEGEDDLVEVASRQTGGLED